MTKKFLILGGACVAAWTMWFWVQKVEIARQVADAAAKGSPRGNLSDLYPRWLGARELLLHHRDPYGADITREIQTGYYGRPIDPNRPNDPKDQQAFAYPVYVVFVLAPTIRLPFVAVQRWFFCTLIGLTACSIPLWFRVLKWPASATTRSLWIILALGCFPAVQGFKLQQLSLVVAALIAISFALLARDSFFLSGIVLALSAIKPQLAALPAAWLCLWTLARWRQRRGFVWGFGLTLAALTIGGEFLLPGWIGEFRRASYDYLRYTGGGRSVLDVEFTPFFGRLISLLLIGVFLYWAWRLRGAAAGSLSFGWMLALTMATTLAIIPMFTPYNQVLLIPVLMVLVRAAASSWRQGPFTRFLMVLTGFSIAWPWIAAAGLTLAMLFLPAAVVQRASMAPILTNFLIPTVTLILLLATARTQRDTLTA